MPPTCLGLFEAIISDTCETIFQGLTPEQLASRATEEVLKEVGTRYLAIATSPACLSLHRLAVAEQPRIPEVAQRFWKLGPGRSRAFLAEFFDRQIERGLLQMPNSRAGAEYFLEMLSGTVRLQCLIGLRQPPTPDEIEGMVQGAVAQFLNGCLVHKDHATRNRNHRRARTSSTLTDNCRQQALHLKTQRHR